MSKRLKVLPGQSLPLRFDLRPSLNLNASFCPCITTILPFREHFSIKSNELQVEDIRNGIKRAGVEIVRILDPEHREPFVSLSRIFTACSISTLEGIITFDLRESDYDLLLSGIAPFKDIWVNLVTVRRIATELKIIDELAGLLEWETRLAWSVEDKEVGGLVHNWKISTEQILPDNYSTNSMLSTPFPRLRLLPKGTQVRTLLPETKETINTSTFDTHLIHSNWESLNSKLVEWTLHEYENYLSILEDEKVDSDEGIETDSNLSDSVEAENSQGELALTLSSFFSTSLAFLILSNSLPNGSLPATELPGSSIIIGFKTSTDVELTLNDQNSTSINSKRKEENFLHLEKNEIVSAFTSTSNTLVGKKKSALAMCEFIARLMMKEWRRYEEGLVKQKRIEGDENVQVKVKPISAETTHDVRLELRALDEKMIRREEMKREEYQHEKEQLEKGLDEVKRLVDGLINRLEVLEGKSVSVESDLKVENNIGELESNEESRNISARNLNYILITIILLLILSHIPFTVLQL